MGPRRLGLAAVLATVLVMPAAASAQSPDPFGSLNDLLALGQAGGQTPGEVPLQHNLEPPLTATPLVPCDAGSKPQPGIDGRVPAGSATNGLTCNTTQVAHQGHAGGFKVWRYTDVHGRTCAYYDTALLFPLNALKLSGDSLGVAVLDMSDPTHPVQTDTLTELPMMSPHESLNVNAERGLIAAVLGNPATYPGLVSVYDAHEDCRHPVLKSSSLTARLGHESGFTADGKTFYAAGTAVKAITAVDVDNPAIQHAVWQGNVSSHGMSLSDDGKRLYIADAVGGQLTILDVSDIQARKSNPQAREVARLSWNTVSIPQNAYPFTEDGHHYLLEFDEYTAGTTGGGDANQVGAARIIDIEDETKPRVISNMRLQVNQPSDHKAAQGDPGAISPVQGYAAHYCNIPFETDPKIVACSFITSGLRLFDISDVMHPKEIGYFVAPTKAAVENGEMASNYAMSRPAFDMDRHDIWYTDGASGFYVVHVADSVWPKAAAKPAATCTSKRKFAVKVVLPKGSKVKSVKATLGGKTIKTKRTGRTIKLTADLRGKVKATTKLVVKAKLKNGKTVTRTRTYHPCTKRG